MWSRRDVPQIEHLGFLCLGSENHIKNKTLEDREVQNCELKKFSVFRDNLCLSKGHVERLPPLPHRHSGFCSVPAMDFLAEFFGEERPLNKTRKQNFHEIVPGFWGEFCLCVFSPPKGMTRKKHINNILPPAQSQDNPANLFMFMCFSFPCMCLYQMAHRKRNGGGCRPCKYPYRLGAEKGQNFKMPSRLQHELLSGQGG